MGIEYSFGKAYEGVEGPCLCRADSSRCANNIGRCAGATEIESLDDTDDAGETPRILESN